MFRLRWSPRHGLLLVMASFLALPLSGCGSNPPPPVAAVVAESGVVIRMVEGQDPIPKSRKIWRSQREDHVRWVNETAVERTITFQAGIWPFEEAQVDIIVPANGKSDWFTVGPSLQIRQYEYHVEPPLKPITGPPGEPDVSGGD